MAEMHRTGGCLCGAVRYAAIVRAPRVGACHCAQCLKWTGGPMLGVTVDGARWEGEVATFRSSDWAERGFCPRCGSSLFYRITLTEGPHAGETHVTLGSLDDAAGLALGLELFADRPGGAYAFAGGHERMTAAQTLAFFGGGAA